MTKMCTLFHIHRNSGLGKQLTQALADNSYLVMMPGITIRERPEEYILQLYYDRVDTYSWLELCLAEFGDNWLIKTAMIIIEHMYQRCVNLKTTENLEVSAITATVRGKLKAAGMAHDPEAVYHDIYRTLSSNTPVHPNELLM